MKAWIIRLAWRVLYQLSDDYEWVVYVDGEPRASYAGWIDNPGQVLDLYIGAHPESKVRMVRRLRVPGQVVLS